MKSILIDKTDLVLFFSTTDGKSYYSNSPKKVVCLSFKNMNIKGKLILFLSFIF